MKLTKIFAGLVMAGALAACSQVSDTVSSVKDAAGSAVSGVSDVASSAVTGVKDVATSAATGVKGAATATVDGVKTAANAVMGTSKPVFETAAYFCDVEGQKNQVVSVAYAFVDGKPYTATVTINTKAKGKQVVGSEMKFDSAFKDGARFVDGNKFWNLDYGFSAATVGKTVPVMFTDNNKILAKNCKHAR